MAPQKPFRLWPGVVAVVLQWLVGLVVPLVVPGTGIYPVLGLFLGGVVVLLWWLFFSRAPWLERVGAIVLMVVGLYATSYAVHESIATGMMGMLLFIYAVPVLSLALVAWAVASRRMSDGRRRASMVAAIVLACCVFTLLRTAGVAGEGTSDFEWRWTPTPEERLLSQAKDGPMALAPAPVAAEGPTEPIAPRTGPEPAAPAAAQAQQERVGALPGARVAAAPPSPATASVRAEWPGFRGADRDGIVRGVRIETDWGRFPPVQLWRRAIGPGWSSFAVSGDLLYTQEQRGDDEVVACYRVTTGEPVWRHRDAVRFWESNAGAGPRATPTVSNGRVYTLGATGILNALNATSGAVVWMRNAASDAGTKVPIWGFSGSPLVADEVVVVAVAGRLVGYDVADGKLRWLGPERGGSYSSPHRATLDGVGQVLLLTDAGVTSVAQADGALQWEDAWPGSAIVQPAVTTDGGMLVSTGGNSGGVGIRRLAVAHGPEGWSVEARWTSVGLKPYFNDLVVHKGYAFGFDGSILACIDMADGKRQWKGGRYGNGQLVLLPDQDVLLVLSEEGELALVWAAPEQFRELARFPAIEGKTWNHPVLVGDVLLVRNGEEMAALRLVRAGR